MIYNGIKLLLFVQMNIGIRLISEYLFQNDVIYNDNKCRSDRADNACFKSGCNIIEFYIAFACRYFYSHHAAVYLFYLGFLAVDCCAPAAFPRYSERNKSVLSERGSSLKAVCRRCERIYSRLCKLLCCQVQAQSEYRRIFQSVHLSARQHGRAYCHGCS